MIEILKYARAFRDAVLQGNSSDRMCVALSAPLHAAFQAQGIQCELVVSDLGECEHIFLKLPDRQVLDPTADQFNWCSQQKLPGVYLGEPKLIHQDAVAWPGGQEWHELMATLRRFYPNLDASKVGRTVSLVLRTLPPGVCEFN